MRKDFGNISGRAWVFGNNINTDQIIQGQYLTLLDYGEMAKHTFEIPRPVFPSKVKENDIVVAGSNFGGGCVVAESFARIFYRNSFNVGLPLLIIPNVGKLVKDGKTVTVNLWEGTLTIKGEGDVLHGKPLPERMVEIIRAGGAVPWVKKQT